MQATNGGPSDNSNTTTNAWGKKMGKYNSRQVTLKTNNMAKLQQPAWLTKHYESALGPKT